MEIVQLEEEYFDLFELPPLTPYDLYLRKFGGTIMQSYTQWNEDNISQCIQTDEIESFDKSIQVPEEAGSSDYLKMDGLTAFLRRSCDVVFFLLF